MKRKSYVYKQDQGYIVCHWDERREIYVQSRPMDYWSARAAVGTANCRNPKTCTKSTHHH
jgi:hypothetical protein